MSVIVLAKYLILFTRHSNTYAVVPFCVISIIQQGLLFVEDNVASWINPTMIEFSLNLMLKMTSTAYTETPFFKKLKNTSQKSTPSYRTVIL